MNLRISMVTFAAIFLIQPILNIYLPAGLRIDIDLCLVSVMALTMEHDREMGEDCFPVGDTMTTS